MSYGDIETLLRQWVDEITMPEVNVIVEGDDDIASDLTYRVPLIVISRFGGSDDTITLDEANVDVDVYASTYSSAKALGLWLHGQIRLNLAGLWRPPVTVCRVQTLSSPVFRDWQATNVRRVHASYAIVAQTRLSLT